MRRPWTLWTTLGVDVWRLLLLTTAVAVVVMSFAVAVRPLTDGRLDAASALRFMALATVPMLQYVLPFAGGFAATLAYHRMAAENEMVAAHAGGVSHRSVLIPAGLTGLVLGVVMLLLADQAMPRLLRTMQVMITQDVTKVIAGTINRGDAVRIDGRRGLHASQAIPLEASQRGGADEAFLLLGVLAFEFDDQGRVVREASAREARVWVYHAAPGAVGGGGVGGGAGTINARPSSTLAMRLTEFVGNRPEGRVDGSDLEYVVRLPDPFEDDPKYLTFAQMSQVRERPERINVIDGVRLRLAAAVAEVETARVIDAALRSRGKVELVDGSGRALTLRGRGLEAIGTDGNAKTGTGGVVGGGAGSGGGGSNRFRVLPTMGETGGAGGVELVTVRTTDTVAQRAKGAELVIGGSAAGGGGGAGGVGGVGSILTSDALNVATVLAVRLEDVTTSVRRGGAGGAGAGGGGGSDGGEQTPSGRLSETTVGGLSPRAEADPVHRLRGLTGDELIAVARDGGGGEPAQIGAGPNVKALADRLERISGSMRREVLSKANERLAAALACVVMVFCGAVMAMRLHRSLPLVVYLWSFLPSLLALVTISGGQRLTHDVGWPGLLVMHGGVAVLGVFALVEYVKLARR